MKKKKLFLLASLAAALAMTSCSSFDEPAALDGDGMPLTRSGERSVPVTTEQELRDAIEFGMSDISIASDITLTEALEINYPVSISGTAGKKITSSAPIVCKASANFFNLTINATTPKGSGAINMEAENIDVVLKNVHLTQNTAGTADAQANVGIAILNTACNNTLSIDSTTMVLPGNYVRAVSMYNATKKTVGLEIKNSHITCGTNLSYPSVYARLLSFSNVKTAAGSPVVIDNSTLEGAYYVVNVNMDSEIQVDVKNNSVLDGRAAFNIWTPGFVGNVTGSTLIGRNNYSGPTESFANIVINQGATGCTLNLTNTVFKMDVMTKQQANEQYAVSFRASNQTLKLAGSLDIYSTPGNDVQSFFSANAGVENIDINQQELTSFNVYEISPSDI